MEIRCQQSAMSRLISVGWIGSRPMVSVWTAAANVVRSRKRMSPFGWTHIRTFGAIDWSRPTSTPPSFSPVT